MRTFKSREREREREREYLWIIAGTSVGLLSKNNIDEEECVNFKSITM
jgi:hypothetical protein